MEKAGKSPREDSAAKAIKRDREPGKALEVGGTACASLKEPTRNPTVDLHCLSWPSFTSNSWSV